ncbi:hypothetical protein HMPREF3198_00774 [Winkia neuii]|nr:hypothetical protein HMPREF3198_00774 [Winkia neuii]
MYTYHYFTCGLFLLAAHIPILGTPPNRPLTLVSSKAKLT